MEPLLTNFLKNQVFIQIAYRINHLMVILCSENELLLFTEQSLLLYLELNKEDVVGNVSLCHVRNSGTAVIGYSGVHRSE